MADLLDRRLGSDVQSSQVFHLHLQNRSRSYHQLQPLAQELERRFHAIVAIFLSVFHLFEPRSCFVAVGEFHSDAMLRMHRCYQLQQQRVDQAMRL